MAGAALAIVQGLGVAVSADGIAHVWGQADPMSDTTLIRAYVVEFLVCHIAIGAGGMLALADGSVARRPGRPGR